MWKWYNVCECTCWTLKGILRDGSRKKTLFSPKFGNWSDHWEEKPFMSQSHDSHIGMSNSVSKLYKCSPTKEPWTFFEINGRGRIYHQSANSTSAALLKNHGPSLKLMAEAESIINSRPLTVETMNDNSREALFHTSMVMNTSMLVPSSWVFTRPDLHGRCYCQRVQHLVN